MLKQRCFNLGSRQPVAGNVDHIVDTAPDPVVSFVIAASSVSCELFYLVSILTAHQFRKTHIITFVHVKICIHIALMGTPHSSRHAGPRLFDCQNAFHVVAMNLFSRYWINYRRLYAEERQGCATRFSRRNSPKRCNHVRPSFGLPVCLSVC